jgi:hypothetical protein
MGLRFFDAMLFKNPLLPVAGWRTHKADFIYHKMKPQKWQEVFSRSSIFSKKNSFSFIKPLFLQTPGHSSRKLPMFQTDDTLQAVPGGRFAEAFRLPQSQQ